MGSRNILQLCVPACLLVLYIYIYLSNTVSTFRICKHNHEFIVQWWCVVRWLIFTCVSTLHCCYKFRLVRAFIFIYIHTIQLPKIIWLHMQCTLLCTLFVYLPYDISYIYRYIVETKQGTCATIFIYICMK